MADTILIKRGTNSEWVAVNDSNILGFGEMGFVADNPRRLIIGDGVTKYNDLPKHNLDNLTGADIVALVNAELGGEIAVEETGESIKAKYEALEDTNNYSDLDKGKVGYISITGAVDLDQLANDVQTNNSKVGITSGQAAAINANTDKVGISTEQADAILANSNKVGITPTQTATIAANEAKVIAAGNVAIENLEFTKTVAKTWAELFAEIGATNILNWNGFDIIVIMENGNHLLGDAKYSSPAWFNGRLIFRSLNGLGADYGVTQNSAIISNSANSGIQINGNLDVVFDSTKLIINAGGNPAPIFAPHSNVSTEKCWYDGSASSNPLSMFMLGSGNYNSNNDTFTGNTTHEATAVLRGGDVNKIVGGSTSISNAHYNARPFTYAVKGSKNVSLHNTGSAFISESGEIGSKRKIINLGFDWTTTDASYANYDLEIHYDFDLGGNTVTIPANKLIFKGGKFINGEVILNDVTIDAHPNVNIFQGVVVDGSIANDAMFTKWFENDGEENNDLFATLSNLSRHKSVKFTNRKNYSVSNGFALFGDASNTRMNFNYATVNVDESYTGMAFRFKATVLHEETLGIDLAEDDMFIDLASHTALFGMLEEGGCLRLDQEWCFIKELRDDYKVMLYHPIIETRTTSTVQISTVSKNIKFKNLNLNLNHNSNWGLQLDGGLGCEIRKNTITGDSTYGFVCMAILGSDIDIYKNTLTNFYDPLLGNGYGVAVQGSNVEVYKNIINKCKHTIVYGGGYGQNVTYRNNEMSSNSDFETAYNTHLVDFHWGCKNAIVKSNVIDARNCSFGFYSRAADKGVTVENNRFKGGSVGFTSDDSDVLNDIIVRNNEFDMITGSSETARILIGKLAKNVSLSNNKGFNTITVENGVENLDIYDHTDLTDMTIQPSVDGCKNINMYDNTFKSGSATGARILDSVDGLRVVDNHIDTDLFLSTTSDYSNVLIDNNYLNDAELPNQVGVDITRLTNFKATNNKSIHTAELTRSIFANMPMGDYRNINGLSNTEKYRIARLDIPAGGQFTKKLYLDIYNSYYGAIQLTVTMNAYGSDRINVKAVADKAIPQIPVTVEYIADEVNDVLEVFVGGIQNYKIISTDIGCVDLIPEQTAETVFEAVTVDYLLT